MKKKTTETTSAAVIDAPLQLAALPTLEHERVWHIPVRDITPSPFQPRKEFPAEEMEVLKQSVAANGIRIPLLGRRLNPDNDAVELIAGERRWRTAQALNLETVPMIVQPLTDDEVIRIQRLENAGRENLKALEAAEDYVLLQNQGRTVEEIMALHGVGRSHVFTRMRVAKLPENIKQLIKDGKLSITIADLIAKLPTEEIQLKLAEKFAAGEEEWNGTEYEVVPMSFRAAANMISRDYCRNLKDAPWLKRASGDHELVKSAGPCATCPKRSGNIEGFSGNPNVCTDVPCFESKQTAHATRALSEAQAKGQRVISSEQYEKESWQCVEPTEESQSDPKNRTWLELAKAAKLQLTPAVAINHEGEAIEVFTREDKNKILAAHKIGKFAPPPKPSKEEQERTSQYEAEKQAIKLAKEAAVTAACRELNNEGDNALSTAWWQRLALMVLAREVDMGCGIPEEWLTGRGLTWVDDDEQDLARLKEWINRQATPHNLVAFVLWMQLDTVNANGPDVLSPWDVDWKQFLPGAKTKSPAKAAKVAKGEKLKKAKAENKIKKKIKIKTAAAAKKGGRK